MSYVRRIVHYTQVIVVAYSGTRLLQEDKRFEVLATRTSFVVAAQRALRRQRLRDERVGVALLAESIIDPAEQVSVLLLCVPSTVHEATQHVFNL